MQTIERFLQRTARWPVLLALALASLFWMSLLARVGRQPEQPAATALDLRWGYTPAEVEQAIAPLSPARRAQAARAHLTLDVAYPLTYGLLFALLLARLWPQRRWWLLAPATVLADLTENALLAALYWGYPQRLTGHPWPPASNGAWWASFSCSSWEVPFGKPSGVLWRSKRGEEGGSEGSNPSSPGEWA